MQHVGGHHRHQHRVGHAHEADQRQQQQDGADGREPEGVADPVGQLGQHPPPDRRGGRGQEPHHQQRGDHRHVREPVEQEAPALAGQRHQHAGHRRPHEARSVHHRRVQGDRVRQVGAILHHVHHEGLARGGVERVHDPLDQAEQQDVRDGDHAGERQPRQGERLRHRQHLRGDEHAVAAPAVHPDAGERREHEGGDLAGKADEAERGGRAGEAVDQPARGHARDPGAHEREPLAGEEEPVVAVGQGAGGERQAVRRHEALPVPHLHRDEEQHERRRHVHEHRELR